MNVACVYEAPMQMLTTEKYIAPGTVTELLAMPWSQGNAGQSTQDQDLAALIVDDYFVLKSTI